MSNQGASPAYRGYRLQALYVIKRMLHPGLDLGIVFHPEGNEDLDIEQEDGTLIETIQVKSYKSLVLSDLTPEKEDSFFRRILRLLHLQNPPKVKLVNFGSFGEELHLAWRENGKHRKKVITKLKEFGFTNEDSQMLFCGVELIELIETIEKEKVHAQLLEQLAGIDPDKAFELLNFWLYQQSENRSQIKTSEIIQRIRDIGLFLSDCYHHHQEWFTSIQPIIDNQIDEERTNILREEFFAGTSARYEHILAGLDFRRDEKLAEISQAFNRSKIVIIHAASGQGKSALAYRYLHETYPDQWRFSIELIENRQHALRIARALSGHAKAVQAPMALFIDVVPTDPDWLDLVRQLAHESYFQILIAIREEDLRRTNISNAFEYAQVDLSFHKVEAKYIFERARQRGHAQNYLNFEEAWHIFGDRGPLMEFVYLLTQTQTLRQRLEEQTNRIRREVRDKKLSPSELELLRLVSTVTAYDARVHLPSLLSQLDLPEPSLTLKYYEAEYLLKVTPDNQFINGLHPIRSQIIVNLLTDPIIYPWLKVTRQAMTMIPEDDWEIFFMQAFVDRQEDFDQILDLLNTRQPTTWAGLAGVLRCLLWAGIRIYVNDNSEAVNAARNLFGPGWMFILDFNFAGDEAPNIENWWRNLGDLISVDRQREFERIRNSQTPKEKILKYAKSWFGALNTVPKRPSSTKDWASVAEVLYWAARFGKSNDVSFWLSDEALDSSVQELSITTLAELSYGLHVINANRSLEWRDKNKATLELKLSSELDVIAIQASGEIITIHFLTYPENEAKQENIEKIKKKSLHDQTIERLQIIRLLYPNYNKYGAQGYGHQIPGLGLDSNDDTKKTGVSREYLPPRWPIWVNEVATGLIQNNLRPDNWVEYLQEILRVRQGIVSCFSELIRGINLYFRRDKAYNLLQIERISDGDWDRNKSLANERPLLPKLSADIWGIVQPESDLQRLAKEIAELLPSFIEDQIKPYLEYERKYFTGISNYMEQSLHVMIVNYHVGKLNDVLPQKHAKLDALKQNNIKTDLQFLSFYNLNEAKSALLSYQGSFRVLFNNILDSTELNKLEKIEYETINVLWMLWYYFANHPNAAFADSLKQVPARFNTIVRSLLQKIDDVVRQFQEKGFRINKIATDLLWENSSTVWILVDLDDPVQMYKTMESLILVLRQIIGPIEYASVAYSLIETHLKYIVIIPTVRGKMISPLIWPLQTIYSIATTKSIEEKPWAYVPQLASERLLIDLGISCWENEDIALANQLSDSVKGMALITSMVGKFKNMPDPTQAGFERMQEFMGKRSEEISELLQLFFDAEKALIDKYNYLSEDDTKEHSYLVEAIGMLRDTHKQVLPSDEYNGQQAMNLDSLASYAERLQNASNQVESIRLLWIADSLVSF